MQSARLLRLVLAGIFGIVLVSGAGVRCQTRERLVEEVTVIGYRRLAREDILKQVKTQAGDVYSEEKVKRDFQAVLDLGLFNKLHSSTVIEDGVRGGVVVIFKVSELPLIASVKFYGLPDGVSESEIAGALAAERVNIVKGAPFELAELRKAERIITNYLIAHGWQDSGVDVIRENTSDSVAITFSISLRF